MNNTKTIIIFVITSVLLFCTGLLVKFYYSHQLTSKHVGLNGVLNESSTIDYLFIGSSHTRMSYDMRLFEKGTNSNSYVVAYNGLSFYYLYPLLKYIVEETDLDIKHFVIESYVLTASTEPVIQDKNLFLSAPPLLKKELLAASSRSTNPLSWKEYYELGISSKNQDLSVSPITEIFLARAYYHGTQQNVGTGSIAEDDFNELKSPLEGDGVTIYSQQREALNNILKLCREHKLKVLFVESPVPSRVEADFVYKKNKILLQKIIKDGGYLYIDGADNYPTGDYKNFLDAGHLSTKGREMFTRKTVKKLLSAD